MYPSRARARKDPAHPAFEGLGIGANTAIFSLLDQVLLRLLPVEKPEELVLLDGQGPNMGARYGEQTFSYPMYRDFRDGNEVFSPTTLVLATLLLLSVAFLAG